MRTNRRSLLATVGAVALPRIAIGQADQRPTITVAVQKIANTNTLETLREQSNVGTRTYTSYAEALIETDWAGDLTLKPMVAQSWRRIDDRTIELKLRQGVRFHDGTLMTAEDVAFSYGPERMWGANAPETARNLFGAIPTSTSSKAPPPEVSAVARRVLPAFERMQIIDSHTVRYINATPDVTLEGRLSRNTGTIHSRAAFETARSWLDWARAPVGTGPYRVASFRPDVALELHAHDQYWGGRPPVKALRFIEVPETTQRINMLLSGEADFACDIPPDQMQAINATPRFEVVGGYISNHRLTVFDKNHPNLADPGIRRAFTHAIDRQAIVDALWGGATRVPKGLQWEFYGEMFITDWDVPKYDPAEARRLLREANYRGQPIPYRLLNNYYTNQVPTAQILLEMWKAVGLNVVIEMRENFPQVLSREGQRGVRDWSNSATFNDPVSSLVAQHGPNGQQWQIGEWRNDEAGRLCGVLETSVDRAERQRVFRRLLEITEREDPAYTVLHQSVNLTAKRRDLRWKPQQSFAMDFRAGNFGS